MSLRPLPVLLIVVATVLSVLTFGVTGAPWTVAPPSGTDAVAPVGPAAGGAVCITGASDEDATVDLLLVARSSADDVADDAADDVADDAAGAAGDAGDTSARGVVLRGGDASERRSVGPVAPGDLVLERLAVGTDGWLWTGWADRALGSWIEWRSPSTASDPGGVLAAACLPTEPPVQSLVGLRTDGSHEALLRIVNPFLTDASFAVTFTTPAGVVEPVLLRNVSVQGGGRVTVRVNDHVPEEAEVAATVKVGAGRLVVDGLQRSIGALGGVGGVAAVASVGAPSRAWTLPWVPVGPDVEGSVWVLNPSQERVDIELTVHTVDGPAPALLFDSIEVAPEDVVRLDAADLAPDGVRAFGLSLRSTGAPVVVGAGAAFLPLDGGPGGLVRVAASPAPDGEWTVAGTSEQGRSTELHVVNLGDTDVRPRVALTLLLPDGPPVDGAAPAPGTTRVTTLEGPVVSAGGSGRIDLPLADALAWSVVVDGGPGLVVARTSSGQGGEEPLAIAASPSSTWRTAPGVTSSRRLDGWVASAR